MAASARPAGVLVELPASFAEATGGRRKIRAHGHTVREALTELVRRNPGLGAYLRDADGDLRPFVLVFLNSEDIRARQGEETPVKDGDRLSIVPAAEGG